MARTLAHPPGNAPWWAPLQRALEPAGGALHGVEDARWECLGELVEALLSRHPELDVHTEAERLREVAPGSVQVLVLREEEAERWPGVWAELAPRGLRVVLFSEAPTWRALERSAADLLARMGCRVRGPRRAPRFAVAGLRQVLAARAPGVLWRGGDPRAALAEARPRSPFHEVSAARPFEELLAEVRANPRAWIAWTDVDRVERLRHVRWALAESRHSTRTLLIEPSVPCPGWWPVHGDLEDLRLSRERLEAHGAEFPGRTAALNDQETEPIQMLCDLLDHGVDAPRIDVAFHFLNAPEGPPDPSLREMSRRHAHALFRGEVAPYLARMFPVRRLRAMCREQHAVLTRRLEEGQPVKAEDVASWTAWTSALPRPEATGPLLARLDSLPPEYAAEWLLASRAPAPEQWRSLIAWAHEQGHPDVARHWA